MGPMYAAIGKIKCLKNGKTNKGVGRTISGYQDVVPGPAATSPGS